MLVPESALIALFSVCLSQTGTGLAVEPGVRQLFLDDVGIAEMDGVERIVHPPARHPDNPLITPDTPWESCCEVYGTAYYDKAAGKFKLWYLTIPPKDRGDRPLVLPDRERWPSTTLAAYAESEDGVHWVKPSLGIFPYDGDTSNNLLGIGQYNCEGISVLHEPHDPDPKRRWKAIYWDHGSAGFDMRDGVAHPKMGPTDGIHAAFSPDGIHWKPYEGNPVLGGKSGACDTNQNVLFDPKLGKYVAFSRFGFGRKLARSESEDFMHWSEPELVLECDAADGPDTQIYGAGVDIYEGVYLGMVWIYRLGGDGRIDTQLATSRDGIHWTRVGDRATWLALGPEDSWEGGMIRSTERIIRRGSTLYIYYCGIDAPHPKPPKYEEVENKYPMSVGLLTQRRDGFVSLRAGEDEGHVLTTSFKLPEGTLFINADATDGMVAVELCDHEGKPVKGMGHSKDVEGDLLQGAVEWPVPIPAGLRGQIVRLHFQIRNADLFSYWWE